MAEKLFRFNPFTIAQQSDGDIIRQYTELEQTLSFGDAPGELAHDIDVYANLGYLIGEMIARYYTEVGMLDAKLKGNLSNAIYRERDQWNKTKTEKIPAISYFEQKAISMYADEAEALIRSESMLKRYKYAYESIESKQNALKKKLDAVKFDVLNR
jgi:hypothetical protein